MIDTKTKKIHEFRNMETGNYAMKLKQHLLMITYRSEKKLKRNATLTYPKIDVK